MLLPGLRFVVTFGPPAVEEAALERPKVKELPDVGEIASNVKLELLMLVLIAVAEAVALLALYEA